MDVTRCNGYELFSVGMVSKPVQEPTPEFQIQQEDFPALPGTQSKCRNHSLFYAEFEIILWLIAGSLESANSSILAARRHFRGGGEKNQDFIIMSLVNPSNLIGCGGDI